MRISAVFYMFDSKAAAGARVTGSRIFRARVIDLPAPGRRFKFRCEERANRSRKHGRRLVGWARVDKKGIDWAPGWGGKKVRALRAAVALS